MYNFIYVKNCYYAKSCTLATSCEELTHWKRPWCWEGLGAGGEGDDRGWDGWMASSTQWTWVWVNSGSWWWTGRPGMLWFMESQRVGHGWVTELNWSCEFSLLGSNSNTTLSLDKLYNISKLYVINSKMDTVTLLFSKFCSFVNMCGGGMMRMNWENAWKPLALFDWK